jgi:uncharacterized protein YggE
MRRISSMSSFAMALVVATTVTPRARAQTVPVPQRVPEVAVTGTGEAEVVPDRARVTIGVQTQAATAADAASRNATQQTAIVNAIKALGVPAERITTSGYNVYPEQVYDNATRRTRVTGYNVQNNVLVDVWNVGQVGAILDAALAKGANVVSSLSFYSSQAEVARRKALQNAVARARADAEAMAQAAGGRLGDLLELSSSYAETPPRPVFAMRDKMASATAEATPISEGTQTISASVSARWAFVAGNR